MRWELEVQRQHHLSDRERWALWPSLPSFLPMPPYWLSPEAREGTQESGKCNLTYRMSRGRDTEWVCPHRIKSQKSPCTGADGDTHNKTYSTTVHNSKIWETRLLIGTNKLQKSLTMEYSTTESKWTIATFINMDEPHKAKQNKC